MKCDLARTLDSLVGFRTFEITIAQRNKKQIFHSKFVDMLITYHYTHFMIQITVIRVTKMVRVAIFLFAISPKNYLDKRRILKSVSCKTSRSYIRLL